MGLFNSFLSLMQFLLPSSRLTFFHFLPSSILLIISCVIHGFLALFSTIPTMSLILSNTRSFVLFHCTLTFPLSHPIFLLGYPAPFVVEYIISPHITVVFSFGTLYFSSIWLRPWQPFSCGQSQYLTQAFSAHPSNGF